MSEGCLGGSLSEGCLGWVSAGCLARVFGGGWGAEGTLIPHICNFFSTGTMFG